MKKRVELDDGFIGGGPPPAKEEFIVISDYIKAQKAKQKVKQIKRVPSLKGQQNRLGDRGHEQPTVP
jgi:hypothetical protein